MKCSACEADIPDDCGCIEMNAMSKINDMGYRIVEGSEYFCLPCILNFANNTFNLIQVKDETRTP